METSSKMSEFCAIILFSEEKVGLVILRSREYNKVESVKVFECCGACIHGVMLLLVSNFFLK